MIPSQLVIPSKYYQYLLMALIANTGKQRENYSLFWGMGINMFS